MNVARTGGFTLPGESGYEALTLKLARRWGADVIRDSDGTELSPEITQSGYGIYSTLCVIRGHNAWARQHEHMLQQTFLSTPAIPATDTELHLNLLDGFSRAQFQVNATPDALRYWQVWDRTANCLVAPRNWRFDADSGEAILSGITPFHSYSVSFLAWRVWEEISMYNHITNGWESEHLVPLDPVYPQVQQYLLAWLAQWCQNHPATTVVRFTSLFYNFVWIWGSDERLPYRFTDWASYDFTVSPRMLDTFAAACGYALTAEDFIEYGRLQPTHRPPTPHKRDYMAFVQTFVADFGRQLVELVHQYGKQAYLFYDDSWVGSEPYGPRFSGMGFDGLIKCVFSGYEARMCAGVSVPVHELRLHPYLFPVGLGGAPTFSAGGTPDLDARRYWVHIRRALLRQPVDRIGLGGYLHLAETSPAFCNTMDEILHEFRTIQALHQSGSPSTMSPRVAIVHTWGKLRSWTLSGHFHETDQFDLIHINEALAGLPVSVQFLDFDDIRRGVLSDVDFLINAGPAGSAWSGGAAWKDADLVRIIARWIAQGGAFLGVDEPAATPGFDTRLRLAPVLGVEVDDGSRSCHGSWQLPCRPVDGLIPPDAVLPPRDNVMVLSPDVRILAADEGRPVLTERRFGRGRAFYLSHFRWCVASVRALFNLILYGSGASRECPWMTDNPACECSFYPAAGVAALVNNSEQEQHTRLYTGYAPLQFTLPPFGFRTLEIAPLSASLQERSASALQE